MITATCVEVTDLDTHRAVPASKDPTGVVLTFTSKQRSVFTTGIRTGEFD